MGKARSVSEFSQVEALWTNIELRIVRDRDVITYKGRVPNEWFDLNIDVPGPIMFPGSLIVQEPSRRTFSLNWHDRADMGEATTSRLPESRKRGVKRKTKTKRR